jgi:hypothetical protein
MFFKGNKNKLEELKIKIDLMNKSSLTVEQKFNEQLDLLNKQVENLAIQLQSLESDLVNNKVDFLHLVELVEAVIAGEVQIKKKSRKKGK